MQHVDLKNISKQYGTFQAMTDLSLTIEKGKFCALLGPSGCGKSTLLRMIAGLEEVTEGQILINGSDVTDTPPAKRGIAMVFQSYALYPHLTVRQNIGFSLSVAHAAKPDIEKRTHDVASMLQLDELLDRRPAQLSGGQRQRVAIGRALVREPEVFLFDEPLSNLDALLRVQMRLELAKLHKRLKATMIYVTHDQVEAMTLADKIVVLDNGRISQIGSPLELYNAPANKFVASFIGTPAMNFLHANAARKSGRSAVVGIAGHPPIQIQTRTAMGQPSDGESCEIGIRPEHVHVAPSGNSKIDLPGTVDIVEHQGNSSVLHVDTLAGPLIVETRGSNHVASGDRVGLIFDRPNIHLFGPNGAAL